MTMLSLLLLLTVIQISYSIKAIEVDLYQPYAVHVKKDTDEVYIADSFNHILRHIDGVTNEITTLVGTGLPGYDGENIHGLSTRLYRPTGIVVDENNHIYFCDKDNHRIRKYHSTTHHVMTIAGTGIDGHNGDDINALEAHLSQPYSLVLTKHGDIIFTDKNNHMIRRVSATTGQISKVAGVGVEGYNGDLLPATSAFLSLPRDLAIDSHDNIYITDKVNNIIRMINANDGMIHRIVGTSTYGFNGDGLIATETQLSFPTGIDFDDYDNMYFSDKNNNRVRMVNATTWIVTTIAGNGNFGYDGSKSKLATISKLYSPYGISVCSHGKVYFADKNNNRIRLLTPGPGGYNITNVAGTGYSPADTPSPTDEPTEMPSEEPTEEPTDAPTLAPVMTRLRH